MYDIIYTMANLGYGYLNKYLTYIQKQTYLLSQADRSYLLQIIKNEQYEK